MQLLVIMLLGFSVTVASISVLKPLAIRLGLVDIPFGRKTHVGRIPLIGGIGLFLGFCVAILFLPMSLADHRALFVGSGLLTFVGVLDDFNEVSARVKFAFQILAALIAIHFGGVVLYHLGDLIFLGDIYFPLWLSMPLTVIAVLGVINAINMVDGVDGLAASLALITSAFLLYLAWCVGARVQFSVIAIFMSALFGYLLFNFPFSQKRKALVFMGDAGSLFLGFVLSWYLISLSQAPIQAARPVTFLWVVALPLFDATAAILRRLAKRQSPFSPDAKHLHHLMRQWGMRARGIVLSIGGIAILMGVVGILLDRSTLASAIIFIVYVVLFLLYTLIVHSLWGRLMVNAKGRKG